MEEVCKHCGNEESVKNGKAQGKQRWKCKSCRKNWILGDLREKYSNQQRLRVVKMYLEGIGIMSIERLEGVPNSLIIKWTRKFSKILRSHLNEIKIPEDAKKIDIIELDELFTYCQKKLTESTYGLLLIEGEVKLLTLK